MNMGFSLDTPNYKRLQMLQEVKRSDIPRFKSEQELRTELQALCDGVNEEVLDHIDRGFNKMMSNPKFVAFIECLDQRIAEDQPDCVDIRSSYAREIVNKYDSIYYPRSLDVFGVKPAEFGLPDGFEYKEAYDFWAFVLGLVRHIPHERLELPDEKGDPFLHFESDDAFFEHMILQQLYQFTTVTPSRSLEKSVGFYRSLLGRTVDGYIICKNNADALEVFRGFLCRDDSLTYHRDRAIRIWRKSVPPETTLQEKKSWY